MSPETLREVRRSLWIGTVALIAFGPGRAARAQCSGPTALDDLTAASTYTMALFSGSTAQSFPPSGASSAHPRPIPVAGTFRILVMTRSAAREK